MFDCLKSNPSAWWSVNPSGKSEMGWWLRTGYDRKGEGLLSEHLRETRRMFPQLWSVSKGGSSDVWCVCMLQQKWWRRGSSLPQFTSVWASGLVSMTLCFSGADSTATGLYCCYIKTQHCPDLEFRPLRGRAAWERYISKLISSITWFSLLSTRNFLNIEISWGGELL